MGVGRKSIRKFLILIISITLISACYVASAESNVTLERDPNLTLSFNEVRDYMKIGDQLVDREKGSKANIFLDTMYYSKLTNPKIQ